jgi:hypothetical protein
MDSRLRGSDAGSYVEGVPINIIVIPAKAGIHTAITVKRHAIDVLG